MKQIKIISLIAFLTAVSFSMESKTLMHIISIPIIDGTGIYTSVKCFQTGNTNNKAAAITNLSLLGVNASLGAMTMLGNQDSYQKLRTTHRIVGFLVTGAAIWMAVSAGLDDDIVKVDKGVAGGYAALTVVPLLLFSF